MQHKVEKIRKNKSGATVLTTNKEGEEKNFECDVVLISVGRKPNIKGLNLEKVGVDLE